MIFFFYIFHLHQITKLQTKHLREYNIRTCAYQAVRSIKGSFI